MLLKMLQDTKSIRSRAFSRAISAGSRRRRRGDLQDGELSPNARPRDVHGRPPENLYKAIQSPRSWRATNCLSPIGRAGAPRRAVSADQGEFLHGGGRGPRPSTAATRSFDRGGLAFGRHPGARASRLSRRRRSARRGRGRPRTITRCARHPLRGPRALLVISRPRAP